MVAEARLAPFVAEDGFLRRTDKPRFIKDGVVSWEAFNPKFGEPTLSFTYQPDDLRDEKDLREYQLYNAFKFGDLPGICRLTFLDFTENLTPPLPPWFKDDPDDERYGRLHCLTDLPTSQLQKEALATAASRHREHALPFLYIRKEKRIQ